MQSLIAMPASLSAGTTLKYTRTLTDLPATTTSWKLAVYLVGPTEAAVTGIVGVGGVYTVTFNASVTANLPAGAYDWFERIYEAAPNTGVYPVADGALLVTLDPAQAAAGSGESWESQVLRALKDKFLGRVTVDQETIQIDGTAIAHIPMDQLERLITKYQTIVDIQESPNAAMGSIAINFGPPSLPTLPGYPFIPRGF
jgi:hypothetical protein